MASQKHVADVPRNIIPRLSWNSSSSRPSVTITHYPALATSQRRSPPQCWSPSKRQFHSLSPHFQFSQPISSSPRDAISGFLVSRGTSITTPATSNTNSRGNPIRHNGVYVATYYSARRAFHATPARPRDHHFDTLKFVKRLQAEGFSEEQSVAMMRVLNDIIQESIQNLTRTMVLREDSTEAQLTRSSHEKIAADLAKLNSRLRDEIGRTQASVRLDLNLEKGRIREEANGQEMRIKETETRIEQEVAGLRERVEAVKFSTLQWLMGVCTGTAALILGAWRLFM
ncbi:hypothetical protein PDIG_58910 [Penicillium digitatum PHI26]|uniref:DUF1640 domain-containing protein n=2 Tax=Penicillium digitatum TaxID=36651 RepID=K9FKS3_PEND2|nr:hypothetical protein PDIP_68360 [Penicillium digitatum Pd1]EKV08544.1 hypothetical protein PDIP_68360 [Penicillium digitatum Pd1]EKV10200.1 hypothetical protein PDIG_58910 [Penicillium digitatum PHI26]